MEGGCGKGGEREREREREERESPFCTHMAYPISLARAGAQPSRAHVHAPLVNRRRPPGPFARPTRGHAANPNRGSKDPKMLTHQ
jgi:hypothetical protein